MTAKVSATSRGSLSTPYAKGTRLVAVACAEVDDDVARLTRTVDPDL